MKHMTHSTDEQATRLRLPLEWDTGVPLPVLLQSERRTFLAFEQPGEAEPLSDGVGIVEWHGCWGAVLSPLNDEVLHGHRLWTRGLKDVGYYRAAEVSESAWIRELERVSSFHREFRREHFADLRHFIIGFHDSTFECVARSFTCYAAAGSLQAVVLTIAGLLYSAEPVPFVRL